MTNAIFKNSKIEIEGTVPSEPVEHVERQYLYFEGRECSVSGRRYWGDLYFHYIGNYSIDDVRRGIIECKLGVESITFEVGAKAFNAYGDGRQDVLFYVVRKHEQSVVNDEW